LSEGVDELASGEETFYVVELRLHNESEPFRGREAHQSQRLAQGGLHQELSDLQHNS